MRKSKDKSIYRLFVIMITVLLLFTGISIIIIYNSNYSEKSTLLKELCMNQTEVIKSIYNENNDVNVVINFLHKQHEITKGLGTTGEFTIGYLKNDSIYYILRMRQRLLSNYNPIPMKSDIAIPLKYAIEKNTGFIKGLDYSGNNVLAYCTYIPELKWGIVAKMDMSEVFLPFYKDSIIALLFSIFLILVATIIFRRVSRPINKSMEESEENYRRLFEYSAIPIWMEDYSEIKKYFDNLKSAGVKDFRKFFEANTKEVNHLASLIKVVDINQKSVEFFSADNKENVIKNVLFYYNDESLEVFREELIVLAEGGTTFESEMPRKTLSGGIKTLILHLSVVKGFEDTLSNVLVSFVDITERKKAEDALSESEKRFVKIFQSNPAAVSITRLADGLFVEINESFVNLFGYERDELISTKPSEIKIYNNPDDRKKIVQLLHDDGKISNYEVDAQTKKGDHLKTLISAEIINFKGQEHILFSTIDITERKRAEEQLKLSEEKFRAIFNSNSSAIAIIEPDTTISMVNEAYCQMGGYKREEVIGLSWTKQIPPEDLERLKAYNQIRLSNPYEAPVKYEFRFYKKDGEIRDALMSVSIIPGINKIITSFVDITDIKIAEVALRESEQRLKFHFENSPLAVVEWDSNFIVTQWSKEAEHIFGWIKEETIGLPIGDINMIYIDDIPIVNHTMERLTSGKENMVVSSNRNITKSGEIIECIWYNSILMDENRKMKSVMSLIQDITERKRAEESLRESREQLSGVFNGVSETLMLLDIEGNIFAANIMALNRFNQGKPDFVGKNIFDFIPVDFHNQRRTQVAEMIKDKKPIKFTDNLGDAFFEVAFYPVIDAKGNVKQYISSSLDITERKRAEEAIIISENRYRTLFNSLIEGFCIVEVIFDKNNKAIDYRFLEINTAFEEQTGLHDAEGKLMRDLAPDHEEHWFEIYGKIALTGETMRFTNEAAALNHYYNVCAFKIGGEDSHKVAICFSDISELKRTEKALIESQLRTATILNSIADTFYSLDEEWRFSEVNPAAALAPFGRPASEMLGKVIWDLFPALVGTNIHKHYIDAAEKKSLEQYESQSPLNGHWYEVFMKGRKGGVDVYMRDVTERKNAEEALSLSEERFKAMAEASPVGMGVTGITNGEFLYVNPAYERHFGYDKNELLSKIAPDIYYDKKDRDLIQQKLKEDNYVENYEVRLKKKDGTIFWSLSSIRPITYMNKPALMGAFTDISYRKQAEEALKESEEKLWSILNATQESVYMFDREGKFTMSNSTGLKRLNNISEENLIGHNFSEFMTPELAKHRLAMVDEVFRTGKSLEFEDERNKMFFHHNFFPVFKDKEVTNVVSYSTDITESKIRERELVKLNRTLNALGKSSHEMTRATNEILYLDEVCRIIIDYCGYLMVWIGYTGDDREKNVRPIAFSGFEEGYLETLNITWDDSERGKGPTGTAIRTGKPAICKNMLIDPAFEPWRKDAIKRGYASSVVFPLMNDNKAFGAITIYSKEPDSFSDEELELLNDLANDLSYGIVSVRSRIAQKEAEELLANSEIRYRRLFESSKDGIIILDAETGVIVDVNPFLAQKLCYPYELFIGKTIWDIGFFKDIIPNKDNFLTLQQKEYIRYEDLPLETLDGNKIHVEFVSNVYLVNNKKVVQCNIRDISERKKFEDALADKNIKLEESIASKDKFFKIIAHDMKNPFISLLGASELLYENAAKYDSEKIATLTKVLNDSAKSGYDMLLNLLEWSRSQAGSMMFQPELIKLKELINKNQSNLMENAVGKKISLKFDIAEDIQVYADKNMLDTILRNLINNALKFTHKGGKVTISTKSDDDSVIISVKDTGIGIKAEDFDKLFRNDIKYSQPGTEHEGGTGLGLLLCKEFVEKHGGKIWVESEVNKGTTFFFSLKNDGK